MRRTKIVCTLGPATNSEKTIKQLLKAGMDVARLNFSHGNYDDHKKAIKILREVSTRLNKPVAILQDLQGPKLRIGKIKNGSINLIKGTTLILTIKNVLGNENMLSTTYKHLPQDVQPGDKILLDDGLIQLKVKQVQPNQVVCEVVEGGKISDYKGINLPGIAVSQPSLMEKDREDLLFGINEGVDLVAISFVRSPYDVQQVKEIIADNGSEILVIAKLEKPEAITHLHEILTVSDGVMIARGDLGVELPLEKVPPLQKSIIRMALQQGKPVITATQMLESMRRHTRPTRAEVSDVANAIFDGTDAVMLSAETAVGSYPLETVQTMVRIIEEAESTTEPMFPQYLESAANTLSIPDAISNAACKAAGHLNARAIVAFTTSGFTARMVAKYRPPTTIIAFTPAELVQHQLKLSWGVYPMKMDFLSSTDEIIHQAERILLKKKIVEPGDIVVILLGAPVFVKGTTNLMKLHVIGEQN